MTSYIGYGILAPMHDEPFNQLGISDDDWAKTPSAVQLALQSLLDIVQAQSTQIKLLQTHVRNLETKLGQTSRNSSKPQSSDPPSAPTKPARVSRGRTAGGQKGHDGHQRPLVPPERVDEVVEVRPSACAICHTILAADLPVLGLPQCVQMRCYGAKAVLGRVVCQAADLWSGC